MMLNLNPPRHTRLRGLLMTAYVMRQMAGSQTLIQATSSSTTSWPAERRTYQGACCNSPSNSAVG